MRFTTDHSVNGQGVLKLECELLDAVARVLASGPAVVGLALPDGGSSFLPLTMGEVLQRAGYAGHITAGGAFAGLARRWLLVRYDWLNSVVRFAGEVPLVELARAVRSGAPELELVAGLTTRAGVRFTFHNDAPVVPPDMLRLVWAGVNRVTSPSSAETLDHGRRVSAS